MHMVLRPHPSAANKCDPDDYKFSTGLKTVFHHSSSHQIHELDGEMDPGSTLQRPQQRGSRKSHVPGMTSCGKRICGDFPGGVTSQNFIPRDGNHKVKPMENPLCAVILVFFF